MNKSESTRILTAPCFFFTLLKKGTVSRPGVYHIFISFLFCTMLFLIGSCEKDEAEPERIEDLTGVWELTTSQTLNSCTVINPNAQKEQITLLQCGNEITLITGGGLLGAGIIIGNRMEFTGSEIEVDDSGCRKTLMYSGSLAGNSQNLTGEFLTQISFDPATCEIQPPCTIEASATLRLTASYTNCIDRDVFGQPSNSDYVLPWLPDYTYMLNNGYCFPAGGHKEQQAYDFLIPIGDTIVASRAGIVRQTKQDSPDNGLGTDHNHVMIEHQDGTVAFYAHLKQNGVIVALNEQVAIGQPIALAGHSGTTDVVHLHFGVYDSWPPTEGFDRAINFKNMEGPVDCRRGLIMGEVYKAVKL